MKLSATFILIFVLHKSLGYQVNPETRNAYTDAIEKTVKKPKPADTDALSFSAKTLSTLPKPAERKDAGPVNYWFHPDIHTFGNTGILGGLHAAVAPMATKIIDVAAYNGKPIREKIARKLRKLVGKPNARVLDLCSGVGISTRALQGAFHDAEVVLGIDTSPEMIAMAKMLSSDNLLTRFASFVDSFLEIGSRTVKETVHRYPFYAVGNAESTDLPGDHFDLVTIMYGFHEVPFLGRYRILREARRVLASGGTLAVVDICPSYTPGPQMLAGEPYVLEYQRNINRQLGLIKGFADVKYEEVVENHVGVWLLTRTPSPSSRKALEGRSATQELPTGNVAPSSERTE